MKKAWEINASELTLESRVDGGSEGAFGEVWRGRLGDVVVAVKMLRPELLELDEAVLAEFEREVEFMQRTRHPNLVRFFGAGRNHEGTPFLVEELMPNGSLKSVLRGVGARELRWPERATLAADIALGMAHIHSLGHIHRDLKSGNVLISGSFRAKVADFGSIRHLFSPSGSGTFFPSSSGTTLVSMPARDDSSSNLNSFVFGSITLTNGVGTPMYMSPEALAGDDYTQSTDVFSYGVLLWELAAQMAPDLAEQEGITSGPLLGVLCRLLQEGKRLRVPQGWPQAYVALMELCWASQPASRPSFDEVVATVNAAMLNVATC